MAQTTPPVAEAAPQLPDLASRRLGGSVSATNDELFADRENLVKAADPVFSPYTFGHKGQIMDGWETRRRREPGFDWAVVRLGVPGVVRAVVVDTSFFTGNYPPEVSVEGAAIDGYPSAEELAAVEWLPLVPRSRAAGDTRNGYQVTDAPWVTHVRLCQYPDGGVARLRVHGEPVPDPRFLLGSMVDLAALANGGAIAGCSNMHYSSPTNLISPGEARVMGEGWETARRRDAGNDWVEITLAGPGAVQLAELDTSCFVGNAPGWATITGRDTRTINRGSGEVELLPRTRLQPDTRHRFRLADAPEITQVRVDIYPDGGMARVRLWGALSTAGREALALRWLNTIPAAYATTVLAADYGMPRADAEQLVAGRPLNSPEHVPKLLRLAES
jgi:allantoicase